MTAGTKVQTADGNTVKARELSGANNLLFRRNSVSGAVEVVIRTSSVPVCCASCTELRKDWALITKKV